MRDQSALRIAAAVGCIAFSYACTPVRGTESSASSGHEDRDAGDSDSDAESNAGHAAGAGGEAGASAGSKAETGKEPTNTSGPTSGSGGAAEPGTSGGPKNSGPENAAAGKAGSAEAGTGGMPAAGSGGSSGSTASSSVHGVLLDARRRPLADVALRFGDLTAMTDVAGKFSVDGVPPTYDVAFRLNTTVDQMPASYAWRFEGLTRRDPTLIVYPAAEQQLANLTWHTRGATFPLTDAQRMLAGFGSPDGDFSVGLNTADYESPLVYWSGPTTTVGITHSILYTVTGPEELPLEYLAQDSRPVTLTVGGSAEASFDFANTKPPQGAVTGRVTAAGQGARENWIVLRWNDGSEFLIADDEAASDAFSYLVPTIANASAAVIALQGTYDSYPRAIAFADNLSAGQTGIQLEIPVAPVLSAPGDAASRVDAATAFQWTGDAKVFVLVATQKQGHDAMYVVTAAKEAKFPIGADTSYFPPAGATFEWHVETHGSYANLDEAAGSDGLISGWWEGHLHGPRRGSGSFTASALRTFVTPP